MLLSDVATIFWWVLKRVGSLLTFLPSLHNNLSVASVAFSGKMSGLENEDQEEQRRRLREESPLSFHEQDRNMLFMPLMMCLLPKHVTLIASSSCEEDPFLSRLFLRLIISLVFLFSPSFWFKNMMWRNLHFGETSAMGILDTPERRGDFKFLEEQLLIRLLLYFSSTVFSLWHKVSQRSLVTDFLSLVYEKCPRDGRREAWRGSHVPCLL